MPVICGNSYHEVDKAAVERLMRSENRPTALFACSDLIATALLSWLPEWGIKVPDAVSVVGYDDQFVNRHLRPALTTVRQDPEGQGKAAAEMMIRMIKGEPVADRQIRQKMLTPELVVRKSTGVVSKI